MKTKNYKKDPEHMTRKQLKRIVFEIVDVSRIFANPKGPKSSARRELVQRYA